LTDILVNYRKGVELHGTRRNLSLPAA